MVVDLGGKERDTESDREGQGLRHGLLIAGYQAKQRERRYVAARVGAPTFKTEAETRYVVV